MSKDNRSGMRFVPCWRWFGVDDLVDLQWLRAQGVEEVVTALHHIPNGEVWPCSEIAVVKKKVEEAGLRWSIVESLPVTEAVKTGASERERHIDNYRQSLRNLAACGITTVVYNFMPVLDWVRTDLNYRIPGGISMKFDPVVLAAFDLFILKRANAAKEYSYDLIRKAFKLYKKMSREEAEQLAYNLIVLTQGFIDGAVDPTVEDYMSEFKRHLEAYSHITEPVLRTNFLYFLNAVIPVAEELGLKLAVHPDDPPFPVLGLPRIMSTEADLEWLEEVNPSPSNGIVFCAGSFAARKDNDVLAMVRRFAHRIYFAHLRNTTLEISGGFFESGHSEGRVDMAALVELLHAEMKRRKRGGCRQYRIPFRPDHGLVTGADEGGRFNPGYPVQGRMQGLKTILAIEDDCPPKYFC